MTEIKITAPGACFPPPYEVGQSCVMCGRSLMEDTFEFEMCDSHHRCGTVERHCWDCVDANKAYEIVKQRYCQVCGESLGYASCDNCWREDTERWCSDHEPDFSTLGIGLD